MPVFRVQGERPAHVVDGELLLSLNQDAQPGISYAAEASGWSVTHSYKSGITTPARLYSCVVTSEKTITKSGVVMASSSVRLPSAIWSWSSAANVPLKVTRSPSRICASSS